MRLSEIKVVEGWFTDSEEKWLKETGIKYDVTELDHHEDPLVAAAWSDLKRYIKIMDRALDIIKGSKARLKAQLDNHISGFDEVSKDDLIAIAKQQHKDAEDTLDKYSEWAATMTKNLKHELTRYEAEQKALPMSTKLARAMPTFARILGKKDRS